MANAVRGLIESPRNRQTDRLGNPNGLNATAFMQAVMEGVAQNWEQINEEVAVFRQEQTTERGSETMAREVGAKNAPRARASDERRRDGDHISAEATVEGEEGLLKPLARSVAEPAKINEVAKQAPKEPVAEPAKGAEPAAVLAFRAPELPKGDNSTPAGAFPVPNHSAGASGFGSTWGHAAKSSGGSSGGGGGEQNIIHSE
jgi:hypothetical protein